MRKLLCILLCTALLCPAALAAAAGEDEIEISAPSAILIERDSGGIIYEKNADERLPPASVTKIMTLLLIIEAIDRGEISLEDTVTASRRAASFGGSCVYLEEGEKMSVHEMLKCIAVVSANDCAVAMSEFLCGSESAFVKKMNERALELGLKDTAFTNCTGLFDDDGHYSTAHDLAVISRELVKHELIKDYSTIWMDSIRGGEFGLANTNKLVYWYDGCTGLKTGFTSKAMYCLAATAEREGMELIAVIMHADSIEKRNEDAMALLNFGFAGYCSIPLQPDSVLPPVRVRLGEVSSVQPVPAEIKSVLIDKRSTEGVELSYELCSFVTAPVEAGERLGTLTAKCGDETVAELPLVAASAVARLGVGGIFVILMKEYIGLG